VGEKEEKNTRKEKNWAAREDDSARREKAKINRYNFPEGARELREEHLRAIQIKKSTRLHVTSKKQAPGRR